MPSEQGAPPDSERYTEAVRGYLTPAQHDRWRRLCEALREEDSAMVRDLILTLLTVTDDDFEHPEPDGRSLFTVRDEDGRPVIVPSSWVVGCTRDLHADRD